MRGKVSHASLKRSVITLEVMAIKLVFVGAGQGAIKNRNDDNQGNDIGSGKLGELLCLETRQSKYAAAMAMAA